MTQIQLINEEINREIFADQATVRALLATVFPGFTELQMKQAVFEMRVRGIPLEDIFKKRVYAIKYGEKYNIIFSIDYARALGMKNGIAGVDAPVYEDKDGKIISCSVTVKRKVGEYVGEYTAKVYFDEYSTGRNLWQSKPRTMIAKVAEMHALRKACPEELDKAYTEEEMQQGSVIDVPNPDVQEKIAELSNIADLNDLKDFYNQNKGLGKAFDKAVSARKKELEAQDAQSDPAEPRVVPDTEA